jgi:hypothetical protein
MPREEKAKQVDRRTFLKMALAISLGYAFEPLLAWQLKLMGGLEQLDIDPARDDMVASRIRFIKESYGLDIYTKPPVVEVGFIGGKIPSRQELPIPLMLLIQALSMYPPNFFRLNGINGVRLLDQLTAEGQRMGGRACWPTGIIAMDALSPAKGGWAYSLPISQELLLAMFHHEAYHLCDFGTRGPLAARPEWPINQPQADPGIFAMQFARERGRDSLMEDTATFAEALMMPPSHQEILNRMGAYAKNYPQISAVLRQKYAVIQQDYWRFSRGRMNDQYWQQMQEGKITAEYFLKDT